MANEVTLWEKPTAPQLNMIVGWRQWADAGSVSSALPLYLVEQMQAKKIGDLNNDGFYLFQIPGTHDLVRPVVTFQSGFPQALDGQSNEFYYAGDDRRGVVIFIGDEPHMDIDRYITALIDTAQELGVQRIISLAGVYGELPYDKARTISCTYSQHELHDVLKELAVNFSDYQGGASIGSVLCRRCAEREQPYAGFYAFVPTYDFSSISQIGNAIRLENDYMAWHGIMKRVKHLLKYSFDLSDLEQKSRHLVRLMDSKIDEIDRMAPDLGVQDYIAQLSDNFQEVDFDPLGDVWEDELRRLLDDDGDS